ncbi:MAG: hypothetical protein J3Q66DRAFT_382953 [Benniella sp.]|nr:MAG: hypothetical protein J3Q66DRAFT_382953 [Benniella sp.]
MVDSHAPRPAKEDKSSSRKEQGSSMTDEKERDALYRLKGTNPGSSHQQRGQFFQPSSLPSRWYKYSSPKLPTDGCNNGTKPRRRRISTSEARFVPTQLGSGLAPATPTTSLKKHGRCVSCDGQLKTYMAPDQRRLNFVDKTNGSDIEGAAQYESNRNHSAISTNFPKELLRVTSMSNVSDTCSDRRSSISSYVSDVIMSFSQSSIQSGSSSKSLDRTPQRSDPPVHFILMC